MLPSQSQANSFLITFHNKEIQYTRCDYIHALSFTPPSSSLTLRSVFSPPPPPPRLPLCPLIHAAWNLYSETRPDSFYIFAAVFDLERVVRRKWDADEIPLDCLLAALQWLVFPPTLLLLPFVLFIFFLSFVFETQFFRGYHISILFISGVAGDVFFPHLEVQNEKAMMCNCWWQIIPVACWSVVSAS